MIILTKVTCVSKFPFKGRCNDELDFEKGEEIVLNNKLDGGWWEGTLHGKSGYFPSDFVEIVETVDVEDTTNLSSMLCYFIEDEESGKSLLTTIYEKYMVKFCKYPIQRYIPEHHFSRLFKSFDKLKQVSTSILGVLKGWNYFRHRGNIVIKGYDEGDLIDIFVKEIEFLEKWLVEYSSGLPMAVYMIQEKIGDNMQPTDVQELIAGFQQPFIRAKRYLRVLQEMTNAMPAYHPQRGKAQRCASQLSLIEKHYSIVKYRHEKVIEYIKVLNNNVDTAKKTKYIGAFTTEKDGIEHGGLMVYLEERFDIYDLDDAGEYHKNMSMERSEWSQVIVLGQYSIKLGTLELNLGTPCEIEALIDAIQSDKDQQQQVVIRRTSSCGGEVQEVTKRTSSGHRCDNAEVALSKHSSLQMDEEKEPSLKLDHELKLFVPTETENVPPQGHVPASSQKDGFFPLPLLTLYTDKTNQVNNVNMRKKPAMSQVHKDDADDIELLKIVEGYCVEIPQKRNSNAAPPQLVLLNEKILGEETVGDETVVTEKSIVDTVYSNQAEIASLQKAVALLTNKLRSEQQARRRLEHALQNSTKLGSSDSGSLQGQPISPQ